MGSEGIVEDAFQARHKFKHQKKGRKVWLDKSGEPQMHDLHLLTTQTMVYIAINVSPHITSPVMLHQVTIQIPRAWINKVSGTMNLTKNQLDHIPALGI